MLVLDDTRQKARTEHACDACMRTIGKGETYRRQRIIGDYPYVFKYCAHCDAVSGRAWEIDPDAFDPDYGFDLAEWLLDADRAIEERSALGGDLLKQMRDRWRSKDGSLLPVPDFGALSGETET